MNQWPSECRRTQIPKLHFALYPEITGTVCHNWRQCLQPSRIGPDFRIGTEFLEAEGVACLEWPSDSPDLIPIENVWALLKSGLREKIVTGGNDELFNVLVEIWDSIDTVPVILSMRKRLLQVIDTDGGHTKYWCHLHKNLIFIDVKQDFPYFVQCFECL